MLTYIGTVLDRFSDFIFSMVLRFYGSQERIRNELGWRQFIKFGVVGVSNAVVYYSCYSGSLLFFQAVTLFPDWNYQISHFIGFVFCVLWAFFLNRAVVFRDKDTNIWQALAKFYFSYAFTGLFVNSALLYFWKSIGVSLFVAPFLNVFLTTPMNFLMNKFWTFKKAR